MDQTLMQVLVVVALISAAYWAIMASVLELAPRAAYRIATANLLLVAGVWLTLGRQTQPDHLHFHLADWLVLAGMTLFRSGINQLVFKQHDTPWTHWLPLGLVIIFTAPLSPSAESHHAMGIVWSLAGAWIAATGFADGFKGMDADRFHLSARLAIGLPCLVVACVMLLRALLLSASALGLHGSPVEMHASEAPFFWSMLGLLLLLNYTLGMLTGTRLVMRIKDLAERDPLTNCLNRRSIEARFVLNRERCVRFGEQMTCILFDLDLFKHINDQHGHHAGDAAIKHAVHLTQGVIRNVDAMGRFGGEEFLLLLPNTHLTGARETANRIRQMLDENPLLYEGKTIAVTGSFGVAVFRADEGMDSLVKRADAAMYEAKRLGRNRVEVTETA
ncbi:sensor domain-containing diguanylate cyclase [Rhodoferax aquaticus]|uniref:diguanylate cyclase n=1 Tax=Rhodoferax aquaticus TaxID=2527691 RepID=A0A515EV96_9BURK|nr:GGDEF domain-containing protein [Rhodoferax aquaticus]QDL56483.1 GGDEF domain-containing protein [Rhodoferax aquaticus]